MKKLILLLMLFSTPVLAVEPISGAFGFKLGDVWDGEATETYEGDGYLKHYFIPESPLDAFQHYWVHVTPVRGLIFRIEAHKDGSCDSQFLAFKNALSKKYGSGEELSTYYILRRGWTQGNRTIELECHDSHLQTVGITLTYTDQAIYDSRIAELEPDTSNL